MPNRKKLKDLRGKMRVFDDDSMEFTPQGTGQPMYEAVRKSGGGALMRTTGEKTQSLVAHLKVSADADDPAAELRDQLENVLKALPDSRKEARDRGRFLKNTEALKMRFDPQKGEVVIRMAIDLATTRDIEKTYYTICMESIKCLHYNSDFLKKQQSARVNDSTKSSAQSK